MIRLFLISLLILNGCAHVVTDDYPLFERILRPRDNDALTWQKCVEKNWLGKCTKLEREIYDLTDQITVDKFSDLGFVCKINGERYHICNNEGNYGFCQSSYVRKFLSKKLVVKKFVRYDDVKTLKDGKTLCFSTRVYNFLDI